MKLSRNFTLEEMLRSAEAARRGLTVEAPPEIVDNLRHGCKTMLQPIRDVVSETKGKDVPFNLLSGYRPLWLNKLVGGSKTSAHMSGYAFDVTAAHTLTPYELCKFVADRIGDWPVDQLIYEFGQWMHIAVAAPGTTPRREILTARKDGKKTVYLHGLVK